MNTKTKAFSISLAFHTLMATLAIWVLSMTHSPMELSTIPVKTMMLISFNQPLQETAPHITEPSSILSAPITKSAQQKPIRKTVTTPVQQSAAVQQSLNTPAQPLITAQEKTPAPSQPTALLETKSVTAPIVTAAPAPMVKELPKIDINAEKKSFFASLRSKIQQHLRYPSAARRRGMEGEVDVKFVLESSGVIRDVTVHEGAEIFHNAAKLAVASASGVKIPEALASNFPTEIDLTLEFRLN